MSKSKKLLKKLNKIKSMKDLESLKNKLKKKVKKENAPSKIVLKYGNTEEDIQKVVFKNVHQFISETIGFKPDVVILEDNYSELTKIINQYCEDSNLKDPEGNFFYYKEKEIKKNRIIHVVQWYWESNKDFVSLYMDYKG